MTDRNEAMRLADDLDDDFAHGRISNHCGRKAAALLRQQAERIAELEKLVEGRRIETNRVIAIADSATAERDQLRAEVDELKLAEEGAAQAFGDVVQQKRDLEAEVKRLQSLLDGAYASLRQHAARTTHKDPA